MPEKPLQPRGGGRILPVPGLPEVRIALNDVLLKGVAAQLRILADLIDPTNHEERQEVSRDER